MTPSLQAPFVWFGGKSRAAGAIWRRLGNVPNYVEPFAGSLAVLLGRPHAAHTETVNDLDGFVSNFWRAVSASPVAVAEWADWPVNENDQHARHAWLVSQRADLTARLEGDPEFFDAKIAGWWVWGINCWIGSGWCSGDGPWQVQDGKLVHAGDAGRGVHRQLVHAGNGQGVHRQLVHAGDAGQGVHRQLVHAGNAGRGVHRQLVHAGNAGQGEWMRALAARLRRVRVACGDWTRVVGPSVTTKHGVTGLVLDPPYAVDEHAITYSAEIGDVAEAVRAWAIEHGHDPLLRIALCGYDDGREMPKGWTAHAWKTKGGYGSQGDGRGRANATRETIWFSPACLPAEDLFSAADREFAYCGQHRGIVPVEDARRDAATGLFICGACEAAP
jgi:hypothetical protein